MRPNYKSMLTITVVLLGLLLIVIFVTLSGIVQQLNKIKKELRSIIMNQEEFDAKINEANASLEAIGVSVEAERQEVANFIAGLPAGIDTSGLLGVVSRLGGIATAVSGIFTPPAVEPPVVEPPVVEPPVVDPGSGTEA
jgi:predicted PurR-regulated permease PerM